MTEAHPIPSSLEFFTDKRSASAMHGANELTTSITDLILDDFNPMKTLSMFISNIAVG